MILNLNKICKNIHKDNVDLGWYTDLDTGKYKRKTDDQFFALMQTEISEAYESYRKDLMDDHLPHHHGTIVEVADFLVRLFDYIGCVQYEDIVYNEYVKNIDHNKTFYDIKDMNFSVFINILHQITSVMLNCVKDLNCDNFATYASEAIFLCDYYFDKSHDYDVSIIDIVLEKNEYNKQRQDHKLENRKADGGKKI